jgi:hypothetical protein
MVDPTGQAIGTPKSSSLAKGWQECQLHSAGFEPRTFIEVPGQVNICVNFVVFVAKLVMSHKKISPIWLQAKYESNCFWEKYPSIFLATQWEHHV